MVVENAEVARILREVAELLALQGANAFRVRAYRAAARTIEELPEPVADLVRRGPAALTSLPGIGNDLAGKITEIVQTGTLALLGELRDAAPPGAVDLMRVRGVGPHRARMLAEELGIRSVGALEDALRTGRVRDLRGFGARSAAALLREVAGASGPRRMLRATASQYAESLLAHLREAPEVLRADVAGSYRRRRDTVGDLDVLVATDAPERVADRFVAYPEVATVLERGPTRAAVRLRCGLQVDLRAVPSESWGAALHYFTGSKAHNVAVRALARRAGLKLNEYGLFRGRRRIAGAAEEDVFARLGLPWIPPELREDRGEIAAAREGKLPRLVEPADLRGDLHAHTTDTDGRDTLETLARAAQARGLEYLAVTDHTRSLRVAGGLDRGALLRQMRRIDAVSAKVRGLKLLKGAEVDVLPDGTLDLDDDTLAELDVCVAAVHSHFDLPATEQTRRVLRALAHPSVDVLAHPASRLLGRRAAIELDWDAVFREAAAHGVFVEVDAQPERLDLDDIGCRAAITRGAKLVVSSDAHSAAELGFVRWGVDQARRGWARAEDVANTRPFAELAGHLHARRGRRAARRRRRPAAG